MKRLFSYMKDYKLESILGPLFKMLEASFELFVPLVVARMVDVGIRGRDSGYILKMGGVLVLLALIGLACSLTAQYFAAKAATGAATSLRNDLFSHIGRLSYTEIDTVGTAALITRMTSDINQVQSGINMTLRLLLRSPFVVFGAMVMAFTVDVRSAFVFAVTIPVLCVVVFGIMAVSMPLYKSVQRQLDKVLLTTRENLLGVRVIRAFNRQKSETEKFDRENGSLVRMQVFVGKISALLNPVTYVIINIAVVAVIWVGAEQVDSAVLTQGKVIALVNLIPRFYDAASGQVLVDGTDVKDYPLDGLREKMGVVPQKSVLFKGTLRDNMRWGKQDASDEDIYRALDTAQAREFVDSKGEGLDLYIDQGGHNLSGGQRQRLTIARALVRKPEILIMDDSASALDYATDARLRKAIRENTGDMTVFIVSQRATTIKGADTILVLDEGRLAGMGTHKELLKDCQVYREICLSQLSKEEVERDEQ